jgi:hypothetical protein
MVNPILAGGSTEVNSCSAAGIDLIRWNASMLPSFRSVSRHLRGARHGRTAKLEKFDCLVLQIPLRLE